MNKFFLLAFVAALFAAVNASFYDEQGITLLINRDTESTNTPFTDSDETDGDDHDSDQDQDKDEHPKSSNGENNDASAVFVSSFAVVSAAAYLF